jgi:hypothetical protein
MKLHLEVWESSENRYKCRCFMKNGDTDAYQDAAHVFGPKIVSADTVQKIIALVKGYRLLLVLGPNYDVARDRNLLGNLGTTGEEVNANILVLLERGALAYEQVLPHPDERERNA